MFLCNLLSFLASSKLGAKVSLFLIINFIFSVQTKKFGVLALFSLFSANPRERQLCEFTGRTSNYNLQNVFRHFHGEYSPERYTFPNEKTEGRLILWTVLQTSMKSYSAPAPFLILIAIYLTFSSFWEKKNTFEFFMIRFQFGIEANESLSFHL